MRFAGIMLCVVAGMGCRLIADYDFADGLHADHRDGGGGELVRHDAGSQDGSRRDRGRHDAGRLDTVLHDTGPRDLLVDRGAGTLLFQVATTATGSIERFTPAVIKPPQPPLRWDLGDKTIVDTDTIDHVYSLQGTKTVKVYTFNGVTGITGLTFDAQHLMGPIPSDFKKLTELQILNMSGNQLTGNIPGELGQLPKLAYLNLSKNGLDGPIPVALGQLTMLVYLNLSGNNLLGPVPTELGDLRSLTVLDLSNNPWLGSIPVALGLLKKLKKVNMANTGLTAIPQALQDDATVRNFTALETLDLSNNPFTGYQIPFVLGKLPALKTLGLARMTLTTVALGTVLSGSQGNGNCTVSMASFVGHFTGSIERIDLSDNGLTQPTVDRILSDLLCHAKNFPRPSSGTVKATLDLQGSDNACPSSAMKATLTELSTRNWTVLLPKSCSL